MSVMIEVWEYIRKKYIYKKSKKDIKIMSNELSNIQIQKAMDYLIARAALSYKDAKGKCATFVREAVEFGFEPKKLKRTVSAKDYGPCYEEFGFKKLSKETSYEPGDIAIIQYEPHGHIAMYCKGLDSRTGKMTECWISDFRQRDLYGGKIREQNPHFDIYRYDNSSST